MRKKEGGQGSKREREPRLNRAKGSEARTLRRQGARGACENKRGNFAKAIEDYNMALAIDKERTMSPTLNRRQVFRATQSNLSNILDYTHGRRNSNGSKAEHNSFLYQGHQLDMNSSSMIS